MSFQVLSDVTTYGEHIGSRSHEFDLRLGRGRATGRIVPSLRKPGALPEHRAFRHVRDVVPLTRATQVLPNGEVKKEVAPSLRDMASFAVDGGCSILLGVEFDAIGLHDLDDAP